MSTVSTRRGAGLSIAIASLAIAAGAGALFVGMSSSSSSSSSSSVRARLTTPGVQAWLVRVGLTPKALAAAGVSAGATTTLVGDAVDHLAQHGQELAAADEARILAHNEVNHLERAVIGGPASANDVAALNAARTTLASAEAQFNTAAQDLFTSATGGLEQSQVMALANIRSNGHWSVPTEFMVTNRTEPQWVALRDALASKRIALREGREVDGHALQIIAEATDPATASAAASLAHLNAVSAAWTAATNQAEGR